MQRQVCFSMAHVCGTGCHLNLCSSIITRMVKIRQKRTVESPNIISNLLSYWAGLPNWMLLKLHSFCGFFPWVEGQKAEKTLFLSYFQQIISG